MVNKKSDVNLKGILNSLEETSEETKNNMNDDTTNTTTNETIDNTTVNTETSTKFLLKKKVDDKKDKKAFNVYMNPDLIKKLDKIGQKSGWSRNELINMMCQYCVNNLELVEE